MTSDELAQEVTKQIERCTTRVLGVGARQYDQGSRQKFERVTVDDLFNEMFEELDDVIVYAVMARIRLQRTLRIMRKYELGGV